MRLSTEELRLRPFLQHPSYQHLRKAISEHVAPLVLVVGSGLSHANGYPTWKELRVTLETALRKKRAAELDADPKYPIDDIDNALQLVDYWDFFRAAKTCLTRPTYNQIIKERLSEIATTSDQNAWTGLRELMRLSPRVRTHNQ